MRNLKKVSIIIVALIAALLVLGGVVNAASLTLKATADKKELTVGEQVTITVDWTEEMGSAEVALKYDKDKVEYVSASIRDEAILHNAEEGTVEAIWASGEPFTKFTFTFKAKVSGEAKFLIKSAKGFATIPNLTKPDSYDITTHGVTAVTLKATNTEVPTPTPTTKPQETQKPTNTATPVPDTTPTPTAKPQETQKPANTSTPAPQKPTVLPKAGNGINIIIVIPFVLAVTVVTYIQIRKYREI